MKIPEDGRSRVVEKDGEWSQKFYSWQPKLSGYILQFNPVVFVWEYFELVYMILSALVEELKAGDGVRDEIQLL